MKIGICKTKGSIHDRNGFWMRDKRDAVMGEWSYILLESAVDFIEKKQGSKWDMGANLAPSSIKREAHCVSCQENIFVAPCRSPRTTNTVNIWNNIALIYRCALSLIYSLWMW